MVRIEKAKVSLVLGSGAARGWAHIGVIHELAEMGIKPDIIVGASVGAVVAGAYASGNLEQFESWISSLRRVDIIRLLDAKMTGGGFLQGTSLMNAIQQRIGDPNIEDLTHALRLHRDGAGHRTGGLAARRLAARCLPGFDRPARNVCALALWREPPAGGWRPGQSGSGLAGPRDGW